MPMDLKDKNVEKNKHFLMSVEFAVQGVKTVFENVVDMFTDFHFHPIGKKIKDMAAGAVLVTACFAVIVGLILFVPKIYHLLFN